MMNPDLWSKFSGQSELEGDLANARSIFGDLIEQNGLSSTNINEYIRAWSSEISYIRENQVPAHTENQRIDRLIDLESVATLEESPGKILLASNPFVLRWFSSYLDHYKRWILGHLTGSENWG